MIVPSDAENVSELLAANVLQVLSISFRGSSKCREYAFLRNVNLTCPVHRVGEMLGCTVLRGVLMMIWATA